MIYIITRTTLDEYFDLNTEVEGVFEDLDEAKKALIDLADITFNARGDLTYSEISETFVSLCGDDDCQCIIQIHSSILSKEDLYESSIHG